ncbi:MAG: hypothetical protein HY292_02700 [Planctomycetes bacterium]|nr:hypothetical protein [Planctomycetota bacterium]
MNCSKCGAAFTPASEPAICPACGARHYRLIAETGRYRVALQRVGFVLEGPRDNPGGRRVDYTPASGGNSSSRRDEAGGFKVVLSEPLDRGRAAEPHVMKVLVESLGRAGRNAQPVPTARDEDGADGCLSLDGRLVDVQVVMMVVDPDLWQELAAEKETKRAGSIDEAVRIVRTCIEKKSRKAKNTLLALDASHFGALVSTQLVHAYLAKHRDPVSEFAFSEVWIVGPTARSSVRLG